jgi:hypothetical protein
MLESAACPPVETVAVLCDWMHLTLGWSSHAGACFDYIVHHAAVTSSPPPPPPLLAGQGGGAEAAGLLSTLPQVQRYMYIPGDDRDRDSDGGGGRGGTPITTGGGGGGGGGCSYASALRRSSLPPSPSPLLSSVLKHNSDSISTVHTTFDLHMTPMSCFSPSTASGRAGVEESGERDGLCILQYSLLQYAMGLLK